MKQMTFAIVFVLNLFLSFAKAENGKLEEHEIKIADLTRSYVVFIPSDLPSEKVPLMYVLHGGTGNGSHASRTMGMNDVATKNHFIVAYPNGTGTFLGKNRRVWNAGGCCAIAQRKNINDMKFIEELTKELIRKYPVDSRRIYATGESNGATLAYRLMCELPDVFAAVIPVSGSLMIDNCKAGQRVALFDIHGLNDKNVPYEGGKGKGVSNSTFRSVQESIKIIAELRQCQNSTKKTLENGDIETEYNCKAGAPIRARAIKGGEHAWPVANGPKKNSNFSAAEEAWSFAKNYSR